MSALGEDEGLATLTSRIELASLNQNFIVDVPEELREPDDPRFLIAPPFSIYKDLDFSKITAKDFLDLIKNHQGESNKESSGGNEERFPASVRQDNISPSSMRQNNFSGTRRRDDISSSRRHNQISSHRRRSEIFPWVSHEPVPRRPFLLPTPSTCPLFDPVQLPMHHLQSPWVSYSSPPEPMYSQNSTYSHEPHFGEMRFFQDHATQQGLKVSGREQSCNYRKRWRQRAKN